MLQLSEGRKHSRLRFSEKKLCGSNTPTMLKRFQIYSPRANKKGQRGRGYLLKILNISLFTDTAANGQ